MSARFRVAPNRKRARNLVVRWDIIESEIDDVYPVANVFHGEGFHYLLGSRAARRILEAYHAGQLPMKDGKRPGRTAHGA
jgi:phosphopantothenate synthetase